MTETTHRPQAPGAEDGPIGRFLRATELDPRLVGMVGALLLIWVGFHLYGMLFLGDGSFLTPRNLWNLSVQTASIGIMATGMVLVIITRNIDLSVGSIVGVSATIVAAFILFGAILERASVTRTFMDLAMLIAGRRTAGPAKVAVVASSLFGTISGSGAGNAAVTGSFTIPLMMRLGCSAKLAAAVEATAATGGQILPPIMGVGAFLMAELLGVTYWQIAIAATLPALLYVVCIFAGVHFEGRRVGLQPVPRELIPRVADVVNFRRLGRFLLPMAMLLYMIASGRSVMLAAIYASAIVLAAANIAVALVGVTGIGIKLSQLILSLSNGALFPALLVAALVALVLGTGLPTTPSYVLAAAVLAAPLTQAGVAPIGAHLFLFYFACISDITPPICAAVYITAGIAKTPWLPVSFVSVRLGLAKYMVPFVFVYSPALLLVGPVSASVTVFVLCAIAVIALSGAASGYFLHGPLRWPETILLGAGGVGLMMPGTGARAAGAALLAIGYGMHYLHCRKQRLQPLHNAKEERT